MSRGVFPCNQTQGEHIRIVLRQYELLELQSTDSSRKCSHKFTYIDHVLLSVDKAQKQKGEK